MDKMRIGLAIFPNNLNAEASPDRTQVVTYVEACKEIVILTPSTTPQMFSVFLGSRTFVKTYEHSLKVAFAKYL